MRNLRLGGATMLALLLAACSTGRGPPPPPPPPLSPVSCPNHFGNGPPAPRTYPDAMILVTQAGQVTLKPTPMGEPPSPAPPPDPHPGVCIDSVGNIHLYHDEAAEVDLQFTIDPPSQGTWPDSTIAFQAGGQHMAHAPTVSGNILTIYLTPESSGSHLYVMQYYDVRHNLRQTEPSIQNH